MGDCHAQGAAMAAKFECKLVFAAFPPDADFCNVRELSSVLVLLFWFVLQRWFLALSRLRGIVALSD
jgi:hypothetical protein